MSPENYDTYVHDELEPVKEAPKLIEELDFNSSTCTNVPKQDEEGLFSSVKPLKHNSSLVQEYFKDAGIEKEPSIISELGIHRSDTRQNRHKKTAKAEIAGETSSCKFDYSTAKTFANFSKDSLSDENEVDKHGYPVLSVNDLTSRPLTEVNTFEDRKLSKDAFFAGMNLFVGIHTYCKWI